MAVKGVSVPSAWATPIAMAVLPVPGVPAISTALPAILPSFTISTTTPAARRAAVWPTIPWDTGLAGRGV